MNLYDALCTGVADQIQVVTDSVITYSDFLVTSPFAKLHL